MEMFDGQQSRASRVIKRAFIRELNLPYPFILYYYGSNTYVCAFIMVVIMFCSIPYVCDFQRSYSMESVIIYDLVLYYLCEKKEILFRIVCDLVKPLDATLDII